MKPLWALAGACLALACTAKRDIPEQTAALYVEVTLPNGDPLPGVNDAPLPLPIGEVDLDFSVRALLPSGDPDTAFKGFVRISATPGAVVSVTGDRATGRNVLLLDGQAVGQHVRIRNARGPTSLWAEDIGYVPVDPEKPPECADGIDNDKDGTIDYPQDPGCAFANDDTESGGTYAAGVSAPVRYALPRLGDMQGRGARTPYEQEGVEIATKAPPGVDCAADPSACPNVIVTRISADGFYVTDTSDPNGYNHAFAFTFSAPGGLRVCDRITQLSGTASEFFGFTELGFPSFQQHDWRFPTQTDPGDGPCQVPEPIVIDSTSSADDALLEKIESALVRVADVKVGAFFGPEPAIGGFAENKSSCDLDGNGAIDFDTPGSNEAACANACGADPNCVEWTGYASRGNYRVVFGDNRSIQVNTQSVSQFNPVQMRGKAIRFLSGTLRNFSGGALNWTIEARCLDDLVCDDPSQPACVKGPTDPVSSQIACVFPRTENDPNEASN
ncbi:MAG: hypothetical protein KC776_16225 [Myxococcales bacterium]|nr:hypothetical protein [Myxococcales bacterium]MCB9580756.1 hypothetical protein [Polyangiaceae bacterium]